VTKQRKVPPKALKYALGGVGVWCLFGVYCGVSGRFSAQHGATAKAAKRSNINKNAAYRIMVKQYAAV